MSDDKKPPRRMRRRMMRSVGILRGVHSHEHYEFTDCTDAGCQPVPESPALPDFSPEDAAAVTAVCPSCGSTHCEHDLMQVCVDCGEPVDNGRHTYGVPQEPPVTQDDESVTTAARDEPLAASNAEAAPVAGVRAALIAAIDESIRRDATRYQHRRDVLTAHASECALCREEQPR